MVFLVFFILLKRGDADEAECVSKNEQVSKVIKLMKINEFIWYIKVSQVELASARVTKRSDGEPDSQNALGSTHSGPPPSLDRVD